MAIGHRMWEPERRWTVAEFKGPGQWRSRAVKARKKVQPPADPKEENPLGPLPEDLQMTALVSLAYSEYRPNTPPLLAVVADEKGVSYVSAPDPEGQSGDGTDDLAWRAEMINKEYPPSVPNPTAYDWINAGTRNFIYRFTTPIRVASAAEGVKKATQWLADAWEAEDDVPDEAQSDPSESDAKTGTESVESDGEMAAEDQEQDD